jgi:hypothetical protein
MGISNVATASSGILAIALGGWVLDRWASLQGEAAGPVAAMWLAVAFLGVGALLLIPVRERGAAPQTTAAPVAPAA